MIKDVQNEKDLRNIPIQKVGVKDVEIPLRIERKNQNNVPTLETVYALAKMSVSLPCEYKGTHMSRFIEILNDYQKENLVSTNIEQILFDMKKKLDAKNAYLKFSFKYFLEKYAPVSNLKSLMCYDCAFEGEVDENDEYKFYLITIDNSLEYPNQVINKLYIFHKIFEYLFSDAFIQTRLGDAKIIY